LGTHLDVSVPRWGAKVGGGAPLLRSQVRVTVLALAKGGLLIDDGVLVAEVGDGEGPHLWSVVSSAVSSE